MPTKDLSLRKRLVFNGVFLGLLATTSLGLAETVLRIGGYQPFRVRDVGIVVEPGGRLFETHPTLGYAHLPGRYQVTFASGYSFQVTHLESSLRVTQPLERYGHSPSRPGLWIFGCSFAYGWSVNDAESIPWLLQVQHPELEVVNFGVGGYGNVHSLIQLREALARGQGPRVAVLTYAQWHDERNTFLRTRRKAVVPWNRLGPLRQPMASLDAAGALQIGMADGVYREFPLMRQLALSNWLEQIYDDLETSGARSHEVSRAIVEEFRRTCERQGVSFVLASLDHSPSSLEMIESFRRQGVKAGDISFPITPADVNLPHDRHPSPLGYRKFAANLETLLTSEGLIGGSSPASQPIDPRPERSRR